MSKKRTTQVKLIITLSPNSVGMRRLFDELIRIDDTAADKDEANSKKRIHLLEILHWYSQGTPAQNAQTFMPPESVSLTVSRSQHHEQRLLPVQPIHSAAPAQSDASALNDYGAGLSKANNFQAE